MVLYLTPLLSVGMRIKSNVTQEEIDEKTESGVHVKDIQESS